MLTGEAEARGVAFVLLFAGRALVALLFAVFAFAAAFALVAFAFDAGEAAGTCAAASAGVATLSGDACGDGAASGTD